MTKYFALMTLMILVFACKQQKSNEQGTKIVEVEEVSLDGDEKNTVNGEKKKLSEYGFFKLPMKNLDPVDGVVPYDLATPLFSDYAFKARFVKVPEDSVVNYEEVDVLDFPISTVLIKNFYYPADFNKPEEERRIIETRLLVREGEEWKPLSYIWNDEQTDAYIEVAGANIDVSWTHYDGSQKQLNYSVPNLNQCKGCHSSNGKFTPIGPTSRQLNKDFDYVDNTQNQLEYWKENGLLANLHKEVGELDAVPLWANANSGTLEQRARAYLDINCAHCHSEKGPANTSGFFLDYYQNNKAALGVYKSPVAAGRGSGGLKFDIHPGQPDSSIIIYRMNSEDPGIMMPEIGKKLVHKEGVELIKRWILSMN